MDSSFFGPPTGLRDDYSLEGNEELYCNYRTAAVIAPKLALVPLEVFFFDPLDGSKQLP